MANTTQHKERVLRDKEEELVHVLSDKDPMEIANNLCSKCVLSDSMWDLFASLDHDRVKPQLQIRYLLRLIGKKLKEDSCVWVKFLNLLSNMGGNFKLIAKKLEGELDKVMSSIEICPHTSTASGEPDIILTKSDEPQLTRLLATISYKWEEIGLALELPKHARKECMCSEKNIISLSNIIISWLSGEAPTSTTLHTLKKALTGPVVREPNIAEEVEEAFQPRLSPSHENIIDSHCNLTIINQSNNIVVADGRSTLLIVQANPRESALYQWNKDGLQLEDDSTFTGVCDEILVISKARQGTQGEYTCFVSSEGEPVSSNKIILTVEYSAAKKRLLDLYSTTSEVPSDSWPPSGTRSFINLSLIKSSKEPTDITDYTVKRSADKVIEAREKVEYKQLFREYKSSELILLEGRPGSGKTTLVHKLIKDWTKGSALVSARWVMLIILRELNNVRAESLSDVVGYFCQNDEAITKNLERDSGEGLCFIIDGLDEYEPPDTTTMSPIYQLLNRALLPKALIIVSSRPSSIKHLDRQKITKRIEILGFDTKEVFQYVESFPFSSDINTNAMCATKLIEYLHSNSNILNMCYLPVHVAMICFLFKCKRGNIPITQTKIYEQFTCCIILRHLKRSNSEQRLESLQDLSRNDKTHFKELGHLAFEMTVNSKQVVIPQEMNVQLLEESVPENTRYLGLVTISHIAKLNGFHSTYTFLHLTFQEFLAAVYISSLNKEDQLKIIMNYGNSRMLTVWTFYCGLVRFDSKDKRIQMLLNNFRVNNSSLLNFAFESQQPAVCDELVTARCAEFEFTNLSPSELLSFNYVMSCTSTPIAKLKFRSYDNDKVIAFLQALLLHKNKLCHLQELYITNITNKDQVLLLTDVLRASSNLSQASLFFQHTDADSMKCFADILKSLSHLQKLHFHARDITSDTTQLLFSGLQHLLNSELRLDFKNCSMNCDLELGKGLQQLTINRVQSLYLLNGSMGAEGAAAIGIGLLSHTKLFDLDLSNNNISDDEVIYLSAGIKSLSDLCHLYLQYNNIGPRGATSLAGAIQHLNLSRLNLTSNNISCEGARALANALQHHKLLYTLLLSGNNIDLDSAIVVITALKNCPCHRACINMKQKDDLSENLQVQGLVSPGDDASIAALVAAAQHNTQDRKLHLGFKKINVPSKS